MTWVPKQIEQAERCDQVRRHNKIPSGHKRGPSVSTATAKQDTPCQSAGIDLRVLLGRAGRPQYEADVLIPHRATPMQGGLDELEDESTNHSTSSDAPFEDVSSGNHEHFATDGVKAGRKLLSMLQKDSVAKSVLHSEPQPLSKDEYLLWQMEARENEESNANAFNNDTFGLDCGAGWSFEENLATNQLLAEQILGLRQGEVEAGSRIPTHMLLLQQQEQQLHLPEEQAYMMADMRAAATAVAVKRARVALAEVVKCVDVEPQCLKKVLSYVVTEGWNNITWRRRFTALHLAAEHGRDDVIPFLIALHADPNAVDSKHRSPLDIAREKQHWGAAWTLSQMQECQCFNDVVQVAMSRRGNSGSGADLTPLSGALACGAAPCSGAGHDASAPTPWYRSEWECNGDKEWEFQHLKFALCEMLSLLQLGPACVKAVLYMVATGCAGVESQGCYTTAMHLAVELGRDDIIPLLISLGADCEALDSNGETPLDVAMAHQHWGCVQRLYQLHVGIPGDVEQEPVQDTQLLRLRE
mmetsp:Transcript_10071/g.25318  ORF Transcript_10071/g.25318 Transcript_10071/m.25318 type:complete len:527 (+) Transcript_10071:92-1672(+)